MGLYGPLASYYIAGTNEAMASNASPEAIGLALSSLVGAALIGVGGARWLTNEVDKSLLRVAASNAAAANSAQPAADQIALAAPIDAFNIARDMK